jgi:uncharacterized membrane protein
MQSDSTFIKIHESFQIFGPFWWMIWNALLAVLPAVFAIFFFKREEQPRHGVRNVTFAFELGVVMLLLPNAPYVATDLIHFIDTVRESNDSAWKILGTEFPVYVAFILFGLVCYSFTTDRLLYALEMRLGKTAYWTGLVLIPLISAVGVYLGRVARFNSWDILIDPKGILVSSRLVTQDHKIAKVIFGMWILLIIVHQFYKTIHDGIRARYQLNVQN